MRLGHAKRPTSMTHSSIFLQAEVLGATLVLLLLAFLVAAIVAFVLVAVWLFNDSKQRGENTALWLTLFIIVGIITGIIGAVVILVIYLVTRSKDLKYDKQGNLLVPGAPPAPSYYGQPQPQQQWQPPPPPTAPGYGMPAPPPAPYPMGQPGSPPRLQNWTPPSLSKVRCPRCRTIFEYQKPPVGQTHVKCPACGEEGNI